MLASVVLFAHSFLGTPSWLDDSVSGVWRWGPNVLWGLERLNVLLQFDRFALLFIKGASLDCTLYLEALFDLCTDSRLQKKQAHSHRNH